jgi:predicted MFS family arabinose efflux permease
MEEIDKSIYFMVIAVAFIDGALRIVNIPTFYLWKDYYHLSPGMNCLLRYITKLPWCIKPLFAYISDRYYIAGYRTKIYFLITGVLQAVCLILLGTEIPSLILSTCIIFVEQLNIAFRDTLAEGLMVVISRHEDKLKEQRSKGGAVQSSSQKYVSAIYTLRFIGNLSSNYVAGILLQYYTPHQVMAFCSVLPALTFFQALFYFREKRDFNTAERESKFKSFSFKEIYVFMERKGLKAYLAFVLIMLLWPNTINGIRYFLIDNLDFTTNDIGLIFTLSSLLYVLYMFFMNTFFKSYTLRSYYMMIIVMMLVDVVVRMLLMVPDLYSIAFLISLVDQSINNLFYDLPSIPLLSIICKSCPESKEATFYAFFVSVTNFFCSLANLTGYLFLDLMDVTAQDYSNVNPVNLLCGIWAVMLWNFTYYLRFPDASIVKRRNVVKVDRTATKVVKRTQMAEYSEPVSIGNSD